MAHVWTTDARALARRAAAAAAACVLMGLGAAYCLTYEPAPRIGIRWRPGISAEREAELERRFLLVNRASEGNRLAYDLLDTSRENIEAMVHERDVADTDHVSRERFDVPFDIPYGTSWMWVADRLPVLRIRGVVPGIVVACVVLIAAVTVMEARWLLHR